jgi:hypothetical protein
MNRRFFDDRLESSTRRTKEGKRKLTLPVSIAVHGVILFAVLVVPYLRYNELPEPALPRRRPRRPRWRPLRSASRSR